MCVGAGVGDGKKRGMEGLEKLNLITVFGYQIGRSRVTRHLSRQGLGDPAVSVCVCAVLIESVMMTRLCHHPNNHEI